MVSIIMPIGISMPPPSPWMTRKATSMPMFGASAHNTEPTVNRTSETR